MVYGGNNINGVQKYRHGVIDIMESLELLLGSVMSVAPAVHGAASVGRVKTQSLRDGPTLRR